MDLALISEGQGDLTWTRWQSLAKAVEVLGFVGLYARITIRTLAYQIKTRWS